MKLGKGVKTYVGSLLDAQLPQPPSGAVADWEAVLGPGGAFVPCISPNDVRLPQMLGWVFKSENLGGAAIGLSASASPPKLAPSGTGLVARDAVRE